MDPSVFADRFESAYQAVYRAAVRRVQDGRERLSAETVTLLGHLAEAGPSTIGELAGHFGRAASTMSAKVAQLEDRGLLARQDDDADGRRRYVWLTPLGRDELAMARRVLAHDALAAAAEALDPGERDALVALLDRLCCALHGTHPHRTEPTRTDLTHTDLTHIEPNRRGANR